MTLADGFAQPRTDDLDTIAHRPLSVADLDAMFDAGILSREEKIELVEGELLQMNSQMLAHAVVKNKMARLLAKDLDDKFDVLVEVTVQLGPRTLVDPDIIVSTPLSAQQRYARAEEVFLAIEVSNTSLRYDLGRKAQSYAKANIQELWVVDVKSKVTSIHREPSSDGYASITSVPFDHALNAIVHSNVQIVVADLMI